MADCVCVLYAHWGRWVLAAFNRLAILPSSTNTRQAHTHKTWLERGDIHTNTHRNTGIYAELGNMLPDLKRKWPLNWPCIVSCMDETAEWGWGVDSVLSGMLQSLSGMVSAPILEQWCLTVVDRLEGGDRLFKQVAGNQEDVGWIAAAREDRMRRDRKQRRNNEHRWIISFVIHTNSQTTCNLHSLQMFSEDFECWCYSKKKKKYIYIYIQFLPDLTLINTFVSLIKVT